MVLVKAILVGAAISFVLMYIVDQLTQYLDGKPKEHKFRK
jgi:hypothetical protein